MALPFVGGLSAQSEAATVLKVARNALDNAQASFKEEKDATETEIKNLGELKLKLYANQIRDFVDIYSKIKSVDLRRSEGLDEAENLEIDLDMSRGKLREWNDTAVGAGEIIGNGVAGMGGGVLLGWGVYGAVATFGTAGTGTAISTLSGAAAMNATLAWLGGGSIALGGGGMALGTTVLGGIVLAPALLITGGLYNASARKKLNEAYSNLAEVNKACEELKTAEAALKLVRDNANQLNMFLKRMGEILERANRAMKQVVQNGTDWNNYSRSEKETIFAAVKTVQLVKGVVDIPLLTEDGCLTKDIKDALNGGQDTIRMLEGSSGAATPNKIKCPSCGNKLTGKAKFCSYCGTRIF